MSRWFASVFDLVLWEGVGGGFWFLFLVFFWCFLVFLFLVFWNKMR